MTKATIQRIVLAMGLVVCLAGAAWGKHAPKSICDYRLGDLVSAYTQRIDWETSMPIRYQPYIKEVQVIPDKEFKSGLITYGGCAAPGRIMRIKLKYIDDTEAFFKALLKRYKQRFGNPDQWRGDAFGVVRAWKWSFKDEKGRSVSLTLQHNHLDKEEKMGNSVKLSVSDYFEEEYRCYLRANPELTSQVRTPTRLTGDIEWDRLIPQ